MRKAAAVYFMILFVFMGMSVYEAGNLGTAVTAGKGFEINSSYISCNGGYKDTRIHVVLTEESDDMERLFQEIREFHDNMNGKPDKLVIYLYDIREILSAYEYVETAVFADGE